MADANILIDIIYQRFLHLQDPDSKVMNVFMYFSQATPDGLSVYWGNKRPEWEQGRVYKKGRAWHHWTEWKWNVAPNFQGTAYPICNAMRVQLYSTPHGGGYTWLHPDVSTVTHKPNRRIVCPPININWGDDFTGPVHQNDSPCDLR